MPSHDAFLNAAPDAVVIVDATGTVVIVNVQAERVFGYAREEMIGRPVEMLVRTSTRAAQPADRAWYVADPAPRPLGDEMELSAP